VPHCFTLAHFAAAAAMCSDCLPPCYR
jgi:hypothetical protein